MPLPLQACSPFAQSQEWPEKGSTALNADGDSQTLDAQLPQQIGHAAIDPPRPESAGSRRLPGERRAGVGGYVVELMGDCGSDLWWAGGLAVGSGRRGVDCC